MTEIFFYTQAGNKLQTACAVTVKALARGMKVMLFTQDAPGTERLSKLLWTAPATGFVPHCRCADRLAPVTPVILDHAADPLVHDQVLVNLCGKTPPFFSRFQRLVEIVGTEDADREAARDRYRFYRDRGYPIHTHQLGTSAA